MSLPSSQIRIEPGSPAWNKLAEMMARPGAPRSIAMSAARGGIQLKRGGGTWTTVLSTSTPGAEMPDQRAFKRAECDHLICQRCGGHKEFRETWTHDAEPDDSANHNSCGCCQHCGRLGSH